LLRVYELRTDGTERTDAGAGAVHLL
jgi:hypothetical protein